MTPLSLHSIVKNLCIAHLNTQGSIIQAYLKLEVIQDTRKNTINYVCCCLLLTVWSLFLNMFAFGVGNFSVYSFICVLTFNRVPNKRKSMASYSANNNNDSPLHQGARCYFLREFFLGNVYRNAKMWFVADVSLASTAFLYSICVVNVFSFPEVVRKVWNPVIEAWYCSSKDPDMFRIGSLVDLLFHVVYLIGSIIMLCGICTQNRWLCGVYPFTTAVSLLAFITVRVWVQSTCRDISPVISLVGKEIWYTLGFWFCNVSLDHLGKAQKRRRLGVGIGDSSAATQDLELSSW